MRILGFFISAAVLHVVVLALSPDNNSQKADKFLIGVALVQHRMEPPAATASAAARADGQALLSVSSTAPPLVDPADKVHVVEVPEPLDEPAVQALAVVTNQDTPEPEEQLPVVVDEPPTQPAQRPRQRQPLSAPGADTAPAALENSPVADHPGPARTLSSPQHTQAVQQPLTPATPQTADGLPAAQEPFVAQVAAQPRYGYHPVPVYPGIARRRGWEGTVEFNVRVLANGEVGEVTLKHSSGYKSLDVAARRAITRWRFTPASRAGRVVESWVVVPVHFVLDTQGRSR